MTRKFEEQMHVLAAQMSRPLNRRQALAVGAGLASVTAFVRTSMAQEATPAEGTPAAAGGESEGASFPVATPLGDAVPPEYAEPTNWPAENLDLKATRNVQGSNISAANVSELGVSWSFSGMSSGSFGALVANPIIVGDLLFQQDAVSNVYALNKTSGEVAWQNMYNDPVPSGGPNGCGVGYGMVFYTLGGSAIVVAADQATGEEIWQTDIKGPLGEGITMAPIVYDSTVYVSTIPGSPESFYNGGQRGFIFALNAADGAVLWYFDTTTDNLWGNARVNSGGGLWHVPSFDDNGGMYVGIGNAAPYPGTTEFPSATSRTGDNDYANSLIKLDTSRAGVDWYINVKPFDLFDLDNQLTPILTTLDVNGASTNVVYSSGKHGIVVAANADTGEELWRVPVGAHQNDNLSEVPAGETVEVLPGTLGGVETSMAFANGVLYCPIVNISTWYSGEALDASRLDFFGGTGQLVALDGATGETVWDVPLPVPSFGGATVVNDLVFTAGLDGVFRAFNTGDGTEVWNWQAPAGINATPAVSGDVVYVPAGAFLATGAAPFANLVALTPGGTGTIESPEGSPAATPAEESGDVVVVEAYDLYFEPNAITIAADTDVPFRLVNNGVIQHDLYIDELGVATPLVEGGASHDFVINAPAGSYEFYCSVTGHREAGMTGTLTVE